MTPGDPGFNPFPGLRPFDMDEEYLFFGREDQRKELVSLLREPVSYTHLTLTTTPYV